MKQIKRRDFIKIAGATAAAGAIGFPSYCRSGG